LVIFQKAKDSLQKLRDEGKKCFTKGKYKHALKIYEEGIGICEENEFETELAVLNGNIAAVHMKLGNFETALDFSNKCLKLNPEYSKVSVLHVRSQLIQRLFGLQPHPTCQKHVARVGCILNCFLLSPLPCFPVFCCSTYSFLSEMLTCNVPGI